MLQVSEQYSCSFHIWKSQVQILSQKLAVLTDVFSGLPQSLWANA
jgi:hypothetical protein